MNESAMKGMRGETLLFLAIMPVLIAASIIKAWTLHSVMFPASPWLSVSLDAAVLLAIALFAVLLLDPVKAIALNLGVSVVLSVWFVATTVYRQFFIQLLTFSLATGDSRNIGQVTSLLPDLVGKRHIVLFADVLLLACATVAFIFVRYKAAETPARFMSARRRLALAAAIAALTVAPLVFASATSASADQLLLARERGVLPAQIVSSLPTRRFELPPPDPGVDPTDAASLRAALDDIIGPIAEDAGDILTVEPGTNVLIVIFEGLQAMIVDRELDGQPLTPNINGLLGESAYYPMTFSQVGRGNTSDAEFAINTGWYSPPGMVPSIWYADRQLTALPRTLAENGYATATFHTNAKEFWNRDKMYPTLGFQEIYDREFFGSEDLFRGWGVHDEVLFGKSLPVIREMHADERPFLVELVTLSSHVPYSPVPLAANPLALAERYDDTSAGAYLKAVHYADEQLGAFIEALKGDGILDDTLLIVIGDHGGVLGNDSGAQVMGQDLVGRQYQQADYLNVPLIIRPPGGTAPSVSTQVVSHVDVPFTVLQALGLDEGFLSLGRNPAVPHDALLPTRGRVPSGSLVTHEHFIVSGLTEADTLVFALPEFTMAPPPADIDDLRLRTRRLLGLSKAYLDGLPIAQ